MGHTAEAEAQPRAGHQDHEGGIRRLGLPESPSRPKETETCFEGDDLKGDVAGFFACPSFFVFGETRKV